MTEEPIARIYAEVLMALAVNAVEQGANVEDIIASRHDLIEEATRE